MIEPPPKISKRRANMIWPVRVSILSLQPWKHFLQFVEVRRESEAVSQIYTAIAKGEKFCAEQILSAETTEMNGSTGKNGLEALLPSRQKVTCKRTRPIVQPVVLKRAALGPDLNSKGARGFGNFVRDFRVENVAILRQARHNAQSLPHRTEAVSRPGTDQIRKQLHMSRA